MKFGLEFSKILEKTLRIMKEDMIEGNSKKKNPAQADQHGSAMAKSAYF